MKKKKITKRKKKKPDFREKIGAIKREMTHLQEHVKRANRRKRESIEESEFWMIEADYWTKQLEEFKKKWGIKNEEQ